MNTFYALLLSFQFLDLQKQQDLKIANVFCLFIVCAGTPVGVPFFCVPPPLLRFIDQHLYNSGEPYIFAPITF